MYIALLKLYYEGINVNDGRIYLFEVHMLARPALNHIGKNMHQLFLVTIYITFSMLKRFVSFSEQTALYSRKQN
jgi:hypothetical protein